MHLKKADHHRPLVVYILALRIFSQLLPSYCKVPDIGCNLSVYDTRTVCSHE